MVSPSCYEPIDDIETTHSTTKMAQWVKKTIIHLLVRCIIPLPVMITIASPSAIALHSPSQRQQRATRAIIAQITEMPEEKISNETIWTLLDDPRWRRAMRRHANAERVAEEEREQCRQESFAQLATLYKGHFEPVLLKKQVEFLPNDVEHLETEFDYPEFDDIDPFSDVDS
jgi:hypothetical protein